MKLNSSISEVHVPMRLTCPRELLLHCPAQAWLEWSEVNCVPGRDGRNVRLAKRHGCNDYNSLSWSHSWMLSTGPHLRWRICGLPFPSPATKVQSNVFSWAISLEEHPVGTLRSCPYDNSHICPHSQHAVNQFETCMGSKCKLMYKHLTVGSKDRNTWFLAFTAL